MSLFSFYSSCLRRPNNRRCMSILATVFVGVLFFFLVKVGSLGGNVAPTHTRPNPAQTQTQQWHQSIGERVYLLGVIPSPTVSTAAARLSSQRRRYYKNLHADAVPANSTLLRNPSFVSVKSSHYSDDYCLANIVDNSGNEANTSAFVRIASATQWLMSECDQGPAPVSAEGSTTTPSTMGLTAEDFSSAQFCVKHKIYTNAKMNSFFDKETGLNQAAKRAEVMPSVFRVFNLCVAVVGGMTLPQRLPLSEGPARVSMRLEYGKDVSVVFQRQREMPMCVSNLPALVVPITDRLMDNPGHAFARAVGVMSALDRLAAQFKVNTSQIVVVFAIGSGAFSTLSWNVMKPFFNPVIESHRTMAVLLDAPDNNTKIPKSIADRVRRAKGDSVCFRQAFVGLEPFPILTSRTDNPSRRRLISSYVSKFQTYHKIEFGAPLLLQNKNSSRKIQLTVVQRKHNRRILNFDEFLARLDRFVSASHSGVGYSVSVLNLEHLTVVDQFKVFARTDILVGVTGAGISVGGFLRPGAVIVEITPPRFREVRGSADVGTGYSINNPQWSEIAEHALYNNVHHVALEAHPTFAVRLTNKSLCNECMLVDVAVPPSVVLGMVRVGGCVVLSGNVTQNATHGQCASMLQELHCAVGNHNHSECTNNMNNNNTTNISTADQRHAVDRCPMTAKRMVEFEKRIRIENEMNSFWKSKDRKVNERWARKVAQQLFNV